MVVAPSLITIAKYGFLSLIVTSAGLLIGNIVVVKHHKQPEFADSLVYHKPDPISSESVRSVLGTNFDRCLTEPSKSFCLLGHKKRLLRALEQLENSPGPPNASPTEPTLHPIHKELLELGKLLASLKTAPVLLEPSMLYCLLSPSNKLYLIKKGFNPYKFQGSRKVVTLGIFEKDVRILDQESVLSSFALAGYNITRSRQWLRTDEKDIKYLTAHYFLARDDCTVHLVVIFKRRKFMRIAGLAEDDDGFRDLLFTKEATFENLTAETLSIETSPDLKISIPSTPVWFLYQIPGSDFVHCTGTELMNPSIKAHPWLTPAQMENRALVAIQELKNLLYPQFISFWLWTETLTGWSEACNIYSKTYELNVAVSYREIKGTNLTSLLANSDYLNILLDTRLESRNTTEDVHMNIALDCYGLRVNVFICFEERELAVSYFSTDEGAVYRVTRSKFQLCSSEVLGQRLQVPCDAKPEFNWELIYEAPYNKNTTLND
ncbi:hypothetical protein JTE90_010020 [Oedothorax gibbosus]|uniref:Uncharacterized protein n=1 Tax=Oedothorax gibbosus TaxID=931172 RepID=A0AAV6TX52_9ARAC|nr:hypothetical protein JTE90_010020 [Oedothorax gibbosus]